MANIKFIKKQSGNVWITLSNGEIKQLPPNCSVYKTPTNEIQILDGIKQVFSCQFDQIESTQIEPAAAVAVTSVYAFMALMDSSFFFSVSGGGSTVTTEEAQTTIENFSSAFSGQTLKFGANLANPNQQNIAPATFNNLDGLTSASHIGVWDLQIDGNANSYFILTSVNPDFIFNTNNYFKHTYDIAFKGGNVDYTVDNVFEAVGYSVAAGSGGDKTILNGVYIRPGITGDVDPSLFHLCVAVGGAEQQAEPLNVAYIDTFFGRFTIGWDGVNDKIFASINDGSQTVTAEITNFAVNYAILAGTALNKVIWTETGNVITNVSPRGIIIDRHTEYIKSNY